MGCNKSKLRRKESQENTNGCKNLVEVGQEPQTFYSENGNSISNFRFDSNSGYEQSNDQIILNYGQQVGCYYRNINVTGSFGNASAYASPIGFGNTQYFTHDEFNTNACNVSRSPVSCNTPYDFSYERYQASFIQHKYDERYMSPPLRQVKGKPLRRCRSFNGSTKINRNTYYNSIIRHRSLENIPSSSSQIKNLSNGEYPSYRQSRYNSRRLARGLKRYSSNSDSLSSDNSGSIIETDDLSEFGPRVKRRSSDNDVAGDNEDININDCDGGWKEEVNSNKLTAMDKSVEKLDMRETFGILDLLMFPEEWSSCSVDRTGLVDISVLSLEGMSVQKFFNRSSQSKDFELHITAIARIENPFMHSYYLLKKHEMETHNEHVDELYLYHGTKKCNLSGILEDNLNWRLCSEKHRFGQGISFSPLATYSSHYSDKTSDIVMLLCKVLTSNSVIGSADMQVPPIINKLVYDTSIKDDASVIVKYSDNEFYPLYKISCVKILRNG